MNPSVRQFAVVTPYFEKALHAGNVLSHGVWVVGPISGLIVAPIVGTLSDNCTHKLGRRRPFIVGGILVTVFGIFTFSYAPQLASLLMETNSEAYRVTTIVIAIIAFCILDLAINTTMWPGPSCAINFIFTYLHHVNLETLES